MKCKVIVFPGSNCDDDMVHVMSQVMGIDTQKIWHKDLSIKDLSADDVIMLPGGFSYGDYLRSGAIARFAPIMETVVAFANKGGLVMGICNGFQILCESGLLPGVLLRNSNQRFICDNVYLKKGNDSKITQYISEDRVLKIPIAHADGRFFASDEELKMIEDQGQIIFKYCDENGDITPQSNPNGAAKHIAGVCNQAGNVFGMMPHPERAAENILGNDDGLVIFESLLNMKSELI